MKKDKIIIINIQIYDLRNSPNNLTYSFMNL